MRKVLVLAAVVATSLGSGGGEEISRSRGRNGGLVVLWPRIVPATEEREIRLLAEQLQERLTQQAIAARGSSLVDTRPEPERACPREGCKATAVGLMLGQQQGGCVVVGVVGEPGRDAPQTLVPLIGTMELPDPSLPFRAAPEERLSIREFVACDRVMEQIDFTPLWNAVGADSEP